AAALNTVSAALKWAVSALKTREDRVDVVARAGQAVDAQAVVPLVAVLLRQTADGVVGPVDPRRAERRGRVAAVALLQHLVALAVAFVGDLLLEHETQWQI